MSDLNLLSVSSLSEGLRKGQFSSVEVVRAYLDAIHARGERGGAYLAVTADKAMAKAREMDSKRASGEPLHALAGVPMALSDNICVKGIATTCGSQILEGFIPPYDAHVVEKLDACGAVLLGKLRMSEFGMGPDHDDGAAAVAAREAAFALASDTGGGIRASAARFGVAGVRPTYGAVSRYGLAAFASSLDPIGVYARDVRDAAMALEAIMGHDRRDATSDTRAAACLLQDLDEGARGMTIALPKEYLYGELSDGTREGVLTAAKQFESMGAFIKEISLTPPEEALRAYYIISSAEASSNLARYDGVKYGSRSGREESVDAVIEASRGWGFGAEVKRRIMLGAFALCSENYSDYYERALSVRQRIREGFERAFQDCDVILAPVSPRGAGENNRTMDISMDEIYTAPASMAGLPALSMGIQLIGPAHGEAVILRAAQCVLEGR